MTRNAISLFSSSGIGDLGLMANGINTVIGCELLENRMSLFQNNYPNTKCFQGNIWALKKEIVDYYKATYTEPPFLILATPPCQGMSSNGMGKMLSDYRKGLRQEVRANLPFVRDSFREAMDDIVHDAKTETESFIRQRAKSLGIDSTEILSLSKTSVLETQK